MMYICIIVDPAVAVNRGTFNNSILCENERTFSHRNPNTTLIECFCNLSCCFYTRCTDTSLLKSEGIILGFRIPLPISPDKRFASANQVIEESIFDK